MTQVLETLLLSIKAYVDQLTNLESQLTLLDTSFQGYQPSTYSDQWRCAVIRASLLPFDGGMLAAVQTAKKRLLTLHLATQKCNTDSLRTALVQCCSVEFLDEVKTDFDYIVQRYVVYHTNYARAEESREEVNRSMFHLATWCKHFNYSGLFEQIALVFDDCSNQQVYPMTDYKVISTYLREKILQAQYTAFVPHCRCNQRPFWESCQCPLETYSPPQQLLLLGLTRE